MNVEVDLRGVLEHSDWETGVQTHSLDSVKQPPSSRKQE